MKRYLNFLRSIATVSLVVLYVFTTLFSPSFAAAEEVARESNHEELVPQDFKNNENLEEKIFDVKTISVPVSDVIEEGFSPEITNVISEEFSDQTVQNSAVCDVASSPVITFESVYADQQPGGVYSLVAILAQIGAEASDAEDGVVNVENNLASLFPFSSGWHEVTFTAQDSDGCVTVATVDIFIFGNEYVPVCPVEDVYIKSVFPSDLDTVLGTNSYILSGQWFPVVYGGGLMLDESEHDITVPHDISIVRADNFIYINVGGTDPVVGLEIANQIKDSLEIVGGTIVSTDVFSGNVLVIEFEQIQVECPDVCDANNGPLITSNTNQITVSEEVTYTHDELVALFGITTVDQDGEGEVSTVVDTSNVVFGVPGTYTVTVTANDNEGCGISLELSVVVEETTDNNPPDDNDPEDDNSSSSSSGSKRNNDSEGEVLGDSVCTPYLSTFMQKGEANLAEDVVRLQTFLNEYMGENLVVDGVYGQATFEAVKRFQTQEFDEILAPWGITEPTGIVRETTMRRINNIMCPELDIAMPILYCATTGNLIYPDGTIVDPNPEYILYNGQPVIKTWVVAPQSVLSESDYQYEK